MSRPWNGDRGGGIAPMTPEMAPLAPMVGILEFQFVKRWTKPAPHRREDEQIECGRGLLSSMLSPESRGTTCS